MSPHLGVEARPLERRLHIRRVPQVRPDQRVAPGSNLALICVPRGIPRHVRPNLLVLVHDLQLFPDHQGQVQLDVAQLLRALILRGDGGCDRYEAGGFAGGNALRTRSWK